MNSCLGDFVRVIQLEPAQKRETANPSISGKFRSLLLDVFGRDYPESLPFDVDRAAVARYKERVRTNIERMRRDIAGLVGG